MRTEMEDLAIKARQLLAMMMILDLQAITMEETIMETLVKLQEMMMKILIRIKEMKAMMKPQKTTIQMKNQKTRKPTTIGDM